MSAFKKRPAYTYILLVLDWLTLIAALGIGIMLRGREFSGEFKFIGAPLEWEYIFLCVFAAAATLVFQYMGLYRVNVFITVADQMVRILKSLFFTILGLALLSFFIRTDWILDSRLAMVYFSGVSIVLLVGGRVIVFRNVFLWLSRRKVFHRNALIVGSGENGKNLAINLFLNDHLGLNLVGFLDDELPLGKVVFNRSKVLGRISELKEIVKVFAVQEIIVSLENVDHTRLINVLDLATTTDTVVKISSPLYDVVPARLFIEKYGNLPVVGISHFSPSPMLEIYKRVFDSLVAAIGLLFLAPILATIAVAVRLDSRGPILFSQIRIGKNGRPFKFYKFRSMKVGSDQDKDREKSYVEFIRSKQKIDPKQNNNIKIVNESRVTNVGRFLRKSSLDELPQLINVLKGDMSLVGPRPCLPYEWDHYEEWHKRRLSVMPGCTGMWQVAGRSVVGFEDMVVLDLYYIQNASALLDFGLLLKTLPVMLFGSGAK
jgi:exopolysaccharide biosynthesis polyprenyl glycosylphosphotransferase